MGFFDRYVELTPADGFRKARKSVRVFPVVRDVLLFLVLLIMLLVFWPLRTVPTGHRGVITVGGAIKGIEAEGFTLVAPWQNLNVFNVRAEQANIDNAEGATSDTQPVKVSMTVRYSVMPDKVSMVFEQFSRDGNLDSYVQTATMDTFKAVTARYTATDLIAKRPAVAADIASITQQGTFYADWRCQACNRYGRDSWD